jgi:hypothetical protein
MSRCRLFAAVAAGLLLSAAPSFAQDRGRGEPDKKPVPNTPADALKQLEVELQRMKAMEAEIQAKMKQIKEAAEKAAAQGANPFGGDRGGFGGGGRFGGGGGGFGAGGFGGGGGGFGGLPVERMTPEQIKELIGQLQKVLEEKTRGEKGDKGDKVGEKPGTKPSEKPGVKPGEKFVKPGGEKPGAVSNDEILKRLDKLAAEVEDIKRSLKK